MSDAARTPAAGPARQQARVPRATYRLQLHGGFGFADAMQLVPYLSELGISHLYISPPLRARAGSQHGYDVVDHGMLNPELGGRDAFDRLVDALHAHDMGLLVDIVPNHMGVLCGDNAWWLDVLENGAASAWAEYFDIDWHAADPALAGKVLLPILGDQYGVVLERGEFQLAFDAARGYFTLRHHEHRLPIDPSGYGALLRRALRALPAQLLPTGAAALVTRLADRFERLPPHTTEHDALRKLRQLDKTVLKAALAQRISEFPVLADAIGAVVTSINGQPGDRAQLRCARRADQRPALPRRPLAHRRRRDQLPALLRHQRTGRRCAWSVPRCSRPRTASCSSWRPAAPSTACASTTPMVWPTPPPISCGCSERYAEVAGLPAPAPAREGAAPALPLYVVVEKIVAPHERLPAGLGGARHHRLPFRQPRQRPDDRR